MQKVGMVDTWTVCWQWKSPMQMGAGDTFN